MQLLVKEMVQKKWSDDQGDKKKFIGYELSTPLDFTVA